MSHDAVNWALRTRVGSSSAKAVLLLLAERADEERNECFPGTASIADDTELAVRTVKEAVALLESLGAITRRSRYKGYQRRTSDLYTLMVERTILIEKPKQKPRGKQSDAASHETVSLSPSDANPAPDGALQSGAEFARIAGPVDEDRNSLVNALSANSAPNASGEEDDLPLGANSAASGANSAPALTEESPELISRSSSSVNEVTTVGSVEPQPPIQTQAATVYNSHALDDDESSSSNAVIDRILTGLDPRLSLLLLGGELDKLRVDQTDLNLVAAASEIWCRIQPGQHLSSPAKYLATCISRTPETWSLRPRPLAVNKTGTLCETLDHSFQPGYPYCLRCDVEKPNWRDERDGKTLIMEEAR